MSGGAALLEINKETGRSITKLTGIMEKLRRPGGCPWDREQTFESLRKNIIEEAHELAEAITGGSNKEILEEAGDLLLQPVFIATIAREKGLFDFDDVVAGISEKLINRHPHVFSDAEADTSEKVLANWEKIKAAEKIENNSNDKSVLSGVPKSLPALTKAFRIQEKASNVGFDWEKNDYGRVLAKVKEEVREVEAEISTGDAASREEEIGDLLFATVNLARHLDIDPEGALQRACKKFSSRFRQIENELVKQQREWSSFSLEELDEKWDRAKKISDKG